MTSHSGEAGDDWRALVSGRRALSSIAYVFAILTILTWSYGAASAQDRQSSPTSQQAKMEQLLKLLDDPEIRARLEQESANKSLAEPTPLALRISVWDEALSNHLEDMAAALGNLPADTGQGLDRLDQRSGGYGIGHALLYLLGLVAAGLVAEWLAKRTLDGARRPEEGTPAGESSVWVSTQLVPVVAFTVAIAVAFLLLRLSPPLRGIVLGYVIAIVLTRLVTIICSLAVDRLGNTESGKFWRRRVVMFTACFLFVWATLSSAEHANLPADTVQLLKYLFGLGLVALAIEVVWHSPDDGAPSSAARKWLLSIYLTVLWCIWGIGLNVLLWVGIFALLLPKALPLAGRFAGSFAPTPPGERAIRKVLFVSGARFAIALLAVAWLAYVLRVDPGVLAAADSLGKQIVRALLDGALILLVADMIWQLVKTYIDGTIATAGSNMLIGSAEASRRARLHTLLPILRNTLAILIVIIAGLTILAEFGVQILPLVAGASIFGLAISFGSQTLVKDIVSGIFYLLDDAFRVGEYVQSGSYEGTVESFSLRSIRLRHNRGPIFTVPFGSLGAIQNMSRDWAIDKFVIRVPFDTDIKLVKRLARTVGEALLADTELGPHIQNPLKMKGVERFGDNGIDLSFSMMTTPGYQTSIRRKAYSLMKDTFAVNGIAFASPK